MADDADDIRTRALTEELEHLKRENAALRARIASLVTRLVDTAPPPSASGEHFIGARVPDAEVEVLRKAGG